MEDSEMQDLGNASEEAATDASVPDQGSTDPAAATVSVSMNENEIEIETGEPQTVVAVADTETLPTDVTMIDNNNLTQTPIQSENKTDGEDGAHQNEPQQQTVAAAAQTSPTRQRRISTPRAKHDNASTKTKNVWTDYVQIGQADEAGTPEERAAFMKELETFYRENTLDFKPPKFYGEPLNCLKLWRYVIKLGGYDVVTTSKLWRQVGESFHPPKTCTTVSWTFRIFYEKALLEYEKHKRENGELQLPNSPLPASSVEKEASGYQASGPSRARRDAAARAMQGWHAQRVVGHGEVSEPIVKVKSLNYARREKPLKSIGLHKQKTTNLEHAERLATAETDKELDAEVVDIGPPADWVKINVRETKDGYEVYALVPGLLREEVRVQSDPAGRLVITGQPEQLDNPWGITPFKKVVSLPSRINPLQTSAVVSLHGRLHVRVPFAHGSA